MCAERRTSVRHSFVTRIFDRSTDFDPLLRRDRIVALRPSWYSGAVRAFTLRVLGGILSCPWACADPQYFTCSDDPACAGSGNGGRCEDVGACSFLDSDCLSGRRYGRAGPPAYAGTCVPVGGSESSGATSGVSGASSSAGSTTLFGGSSSAGADVTTNGIPECPSDWWNCDWTHRHRLSLATSLGTTLADVPVLVRLTPDRVEFERMQPDGDDLRLVGAFGDRLPFEIERWDPAVASSVWVLVPELSDASDHLWLYYGNAAAAGEQDAAAVWGAQHSAVWHMQDGIDASDHGNDGSISGRVYSIEGQIAGSLGFVAPDSRLDVPATNATTSVFAEGATLSAWIRPRGWGASGYGRILDKDSVDAGWMFYVVTDGRLRFALAFADVDPYWSTIPGVIPLDAWSHVAVSFAPATGEPPSLWVDGVMHPLEDSPPVPMTPPLEDPMVPITIGNRPTLDRAFDGDIDEVRIETQVRDAAWLAVQRDAMRDTLLQYEPAESWQSAP